ncbi:MAG: EamA family transporter [Bacteroidales bacterium]|nr:EamA family transporter [Bacteroidales bacterium]
MGKINLYYILVVFAVFASSCSQILLKKSADQQHKSWFHFFCNWRVILAYSIFFGVVILNITAFSHGVNLKDMPALESLSAVFVPTLSYFILKEKITKKSILGILIIITGLFVFYS